MRFIPPFGLVATQITLIGFFRSPKFPKKNAFAFPTPLFERMVHTITWVGAGAGHLGRARGLSGAPIQPEGRILDSKEMSFCVEN